MKRALALVATALVATSFATTARADMYTVRRQGATIVPERSEDISMDAEDVHIERYVDGYNATVTFVMRNHSDRPIDSLVAFPIIGSTYTREQDANREFSVVVKDSGEPDSSFTPVGVHVKAGKNQAVSDDYFAAMPPKTIGDYPEVVVWNVTWLPRQTKVIRVQFDMGEPMVLPYSNQLAGGWQLMYVVTTGSLWKGPIGRADISIRFSDPAIAGWTPIGSYRRVSYPDRAKWNGNDSVAWHFENWTPTEEIWVRSADWQGLPIAQVPKYRFLLTFEYAGAKAEYTGATIEDLATRDLRFAAEFFPQEVKAFDRTLLRIAIADWLLHEIYARHGDPFFLGKESPTFPFGNDMIGDDKGNLYSWWHGLFHDYGYRGGWYRPNDPPAGAVKTATLHPVEQRNVAFLRAYLDKLRSTPKYEALRNSAHTPGIE